MKTWITSAAVALARGNDGVCSDATPAAMSSNAMGLVCMAGCIALAACASPARPSRAQVDPLPAAGSGATAGRLAPSPAVPQPEPRRDATDMPLLLPPARPPLAARAGAGAAHEDICKSSEVPAQKVPVDIFMMVDQSLSMVAIDATGMTRWQSVIGALTHFVQSPESAGIQIGLQYFGLGLGGGSCAPEDYAQPEVEIGALPQNSAALTASFKMSAGNITISLQCPTIDLK